MKNWMKKQKSAKNRRDKKLEKGYNEALERRKDYLERKRTSGTMIATNPCTSVCDQLLRYIMVPNDSKHSVSNSNPADKLLR